MKKFIYYLFHDKPDYSCTCDIDCQCEGNLKWREEKKISKWFKS
jgi:hypothetical protein